MRFIIAHCISRKSLFVCSFISNVSVEYSYDDDDVCFKKNKRGISI